MAIAIAASAWVIWVSHDVPYLGLSLAPHADDTAIVVRATGPGAALPVGTVLLGVTNDRDRLDFRASDFVPEPDGALGSFVTYDAFLDRHARMWEMQAGEKLWFIDATGARREVVPEPQRPIGSLPAEFWIQLAVGVLAWLISAAIWAFRRGESSARYLLLSGFATLMFAPLAAIYTTRELSLPRAFFLWTNDLNYWGGQLFAGALVALLLYYPRRIAPRWVGHAIIAASLLWIALQQISVFRVGLIFHSMTLARRLLVMVALVATFVLAAIHWVGTRRDPVARAALQWFLLSWLVGVTLFAGLILLPQLFGIDTSAYQGYAFLLFLLVYGGLAFGILRFRLFELGEWWSRAVIWMISVVVLVVCDLAFLLGLELSRGVSLALSLAVCAIAWLPLRSWLWGRVFARPGERNAFREVVAIGFAGADRAAAWRALLAAELQPLKIEDAAPIAAAAIEDDGSVLHIPGAGGTPPLALSYAQAGRRLFHRRDVALADELVGMLDHVVASRAAYDAGVAEERRRIASDLHDNLGAPLANALHGDAERKDRLIRETLSDLGTIINNVAKPGATVAEALGELRRETIERTAAREVALDWPIDVAIGELPPSLIHALRSVIREGVTNALDHAHPTKISVRVRRDGETIELVVEDDGDGFDPAAVALGQGLTSVRTRAARFGGTATWATAGTEGTRMSVTMSTVVHRAR